MNNIDIIIGLDFLLKQNGGINITKDYVNIYKMASIIPIQSELLRKHGGYPSNLENTQCNCKILGSYKNLIEENELVDIIKEIKLDKEVITRK